MAPDNLEQSRIDLRFVARVRKIAEHTCPYPELHRDDLIDDVTQDTLHLYIAKNVAIAVPEGAHTAWFYSTTRFKWKEVCRKRKRAQQLNGADVDNVVAKDTSSSMIDEEALITLLGLVSEDERALLVEWARNKNFSAWARLQGWNRNTAVSQVHRILEALRSHPLVGRLLQD